MGYTNEISISDRIIIWFMWIIIFFGRYFFPSNYNFWTLFLSLIVIYILISYRHRYTKKIIWGFFLHTVAYSLFILTLINNIHVFGMGKLVLLNLLMILTPIFLTFFVNHIFFTYDYEALWNGFKNITIFMNIYYIINIPIIVTEKITSSFMISKFISWNPYIPDSITGLIGYSGTNIINLFWVGLLISNVIIVISCNNKGPLIFIIIFELFTMIVFSVFFNENKSFFMTAFIFFIMLVICVNNKSLSHTLLYIFMMLIIIIMLFTILALFFKGFNQYIEREVYLVQQMINGSGNDETNERSYLVSLAFSNYNAGNNGIGLNVLNLNDQNIYAHLGINSLILLLFMGGIKLYLSTLLIYTVSINDIYSFISKRAFRMLMFFLSTISLIVVTIIAQPFRDCYVYFFYSWIIFNYAIVIRKKEQENA